MKLKLEIPLSFESILNHLIFETTYVQSESCYHPGVVNFRNLLCKYDLIVIKLKTTCISCY